MESNIPTAEEFLNDIRYITYSLDEKLITFARLHTEAALKAALDDIPCLGSSTDIASYEEVEEAVLNAYPLTNIK